MKVGYIGLGIMGAPMASNIIKAGFEVYVWSRRAESNTPLIKLGATACTSPADLARQVDVVMLNVSDTPDVEALIFGSDGIASGAHPGCIVVDNSTISPDATMEMAQRLRTQGVHMLDAPVSGGDVGAQAGTLSIMVGGEKEVFEQALPILQACGSNIHLIGDNGAGQFCKACNQILVAQSMAAVSETLLFAQSVNIDQAKVRDALLGGFAQSRILDIHGQRIIDQEFAPGFKSKLHRKDMNIALGAARERSLDLPGAKLATEHLNTMFEQGLGEEDSIAMVKVIQQGSKDL